MTNQGTNPHDNQDQRSHVKLIFRHVDASSRSSALPIDYLTKVIAGLRFKDGVEASSKTNLVPFRR